MEIPDRIETNRLIIRPHVPEDVDAFVDFMTDPEATKHLDFDDDQKTVDGARALLKYVIESYETPEPVFAMAVIDQSTGAFLGSCGFSVIEKDRIVEAYFSLLPRYWGWGFATESMMAILYYAFVELKLEEVVAYAAADNPRSWKVAKNVGMKDQGVREREGHPPQRKFSVHKDEYLSRVSDE